MERSIGLHSGLWASSSVAYPLQVSQRVYPCRCCTVTALETEVEVPEIMPQNLVKMVPRQTLPPRYNSFSSSSMLEGFFKKGRAIFSTAAGPLMI